MTRHNMKIAMQAKGLSAENLGQAVGLSEPFIYQILNGTRMPSLETAFRISKTLGLPIELLFGEEGKAVNE